MIVAYMSIDWGCYTIEVGITLENYDIAECILVRIITIVLDLFALLFYMSECMYVYYVTGVTDCWELAFERCEFNPGPLQEETNVLRFWASIPAQK